MKEPVVVVIGDYQPAKRAYSGEIVIVANDHGVYNVVQNAAQGIYRGKVVEVNDLDLEAACSLVKRRKVKTDIVVLSLPAIGLNARLFIRGCVEGFPDTKFMFVSSNGGSLKEEALNLGVFSYLQAPVDIAEMKRAIASTLLSATPDEARRLYEQAELAANVGCQCAGRLARL